MGAEMKSMIRDTLGQIEEDKKEKAAKRECMGAQQCAQEVSRGTAFVGMKKGFQHYSQALWGNPLGFDPYETQTATARGSPGNPFERRKKNRTLLGELEDLDERIKGLRATARRPWVSDPR